LKVIDKQIFDRSDGDLKGVVANIEISSFIELITDINTASIKRHIFDDNIRVYLGDDGGYNQDIIRSALSDDNDLFWYQNNGVTIVCEEVTYQKDARNPVLNVKNFQIVNGAQTCHALFKAFTLDRTKASNVLLLVKIFETRREDISQRVAVATNSQARINPRDLRANDPIQKKIEQVLLSCGYFYERKKNQHQDKPLAKRVDALRLGQMILAYDLREPDKAKAESDSIFGSRYSVIFTEQLNDQKLVFLIKAYSEIEARRDSILGLQKPQNKDSSKWSFLNYGQWHVLFAIGLLHQRDGKTHSSLGEISEYIDEAIELIGRIRDDFSYVSNYDIFRSNRFRDRLLLEFDAEQMRFIFD
jgi:hypothetical protein